jgi:hypothetical protein
MIAKSLVIENKCLGDTLQLVDVTPDLYSDGQKLSSPCGYKYEVCVRAHRNDKLTVRIPGMQLMEAPSTMQDVFVTFDDLVVRPYVDRTGHLAVSATATSIKVASHHDDASQSTRSGGNNAAGTNKT